MVDSRQRFARLAVASKVFTPGSPINTLELFSGRTEQLSDILQAHNARGQHVALYGERGVGKTSIASILAEALGAAPKTTRPTSVRVACSSDDDFQSLWELVFRKLKLDIGHEVLRPEVLREHLGRLDHQTLIIIDELDRLDDNHALSLFADTVKLLSDDPVNVTIVIVGVADSIDELVGDHESISRALRQVRMQRMSHEELEGIITNGCQELGIAITDARRARIAALSEGLPHYTHALGLYAAQRAITDDSDEINDNDIESAMAMVVRKSQHTILSAFNMATRSAHQDVIFEKVLLACALAAKDELGMFAARSVVLPLSLIANRKYEIPAFSRHLKLFASDERGNVLQQHGSERRFFYRFTDPMMQPFVILNGVAKGLLTEERLHEIKSLVEEDSRSR